MRAGRISKAKEMILAALKHQPKSELLHFNLGNCYYRESNLSAAIKEYETAKSLNPNSQAVLVLIELYISVGQKDRAKAMYDRAKQWADPAILRGWPF